MGLCATNCHAPRQYSDPRIIDTSADCCCVDIGIGIDVAITICAALPVPTPKFNSRPRRWRRFCCLALPMDGRPRKAITRQIHGSKPLPWRVAWHSVRQKLHDMAVTVDATLS